ncbi:MAG: beta-glucosidase [Hyphomicrobiales bacterium]
MSVFKSFLLGGFECAVLAKPDGELLDYIDDTGHAAHARADYRRLAETGILGARDGLRWYLIDRGSYYDWSSAIGQVRVASEMGVEVIWDLCHYDCPPDVDIWSEAFVQRFAAYAAAAARFVADYSSPPFRFCPVNEMSYWAWAGGAAGLFYPCAHERAHELKRQLARAFIAGARAIRDVLPEAIIVSAEPLIHVRSTNEASGEGYNNAQFDAVERVLGVGTEELDGSPDLIDLIGINYYPHNQWYASGNTIPLGHWDYQPLSALLETVKKRYGRPVLLTETGAHGSGKAAWLHYVLTEAGKARSAGVWVEGVCLYSIVSFRHWFDPGMNDVGLWGPVDAFGHRQVDEIFHDFLSRVIGEAVSLT